MLFSSRFPNNGLGRLSAEFTGTFGIVLAAGGAALSVPGLFGPIAAALAAGLALFAATIAFFSVSGGQFNPAVTFAMAISRKMGAKDSVAYICSQLLGAVLAALVLYAAFPSARWLGLGLPQVSDAVSWNSAVLLEAAFTALLSMAYLTIVSSKRSAFELASALCATVFAASLAIGSATGAALNPARAFGPALVSGVWSTQSVHWFGPLLGALIAAVFYEYVMREKKAHGFVV